MQSRHTVFQHQLHASLIDLYVLSPSFSLFPSLSALFFGSKGRERPKEKDPISLESMPIRSLWPLGDDNDLEESRDLLSEPRGNKLTWFPVPCLSLSEGRGGGGRDDQLRCGTLTVRGNLVPIVEPPFLSYLLAVYFFINQR